MDKNAKIYVTGHYGMVGSALVRCLKRSGYSNLLLRTREELDLLNQGAVNQFLQQEKPDYIFMAAAKVGGIHANNSRRADFIYENLMIEANLINSAHLAGVQRLMFLASSCIYPRNCQQPILEEYLLTGSLEHTNEPYAIAKIAGIKLCEAYNQQHGRQYVSVMPTNLYGPNDNYDLNSSHVLPALLRKAHETKLLGGSELAIWGSGSPKREFLYVEDLADACIFLMERDYSGHLLNIGTGEDLSIKELAETIKKLLGLEAKLVFDDSKPDGTPRKLLDVSRINRLGWKAPTGLEEGIIKTYQAFLADVANLQ